MGTEKYINDLIEREKQMVPSPYLSTRVLAEIERRQLQSNYRPTAWKAIALAASFAAVTVLGITLGNSYKGDYYPKLGMNINDSQIENLEYYNLEDYD